MSEISVVHESNFFNTTQPNPSQSKNFGPTNQLNPQLITSRTSYNQQQTSGHKEDNFNISQSVKVDQVFMVEY